MKGTICYVDHKAKGTQVAKIRGTSNRNPAQRRTLCDVHAEQAKAAGYKVKLIEEVES